MIALSLSFLCRQVCRSLYSVIGWAIMPITICPAHGGISNLGGWFDPNGIKRRWQLGLPSQSVPQLMPLILCLFWAGVLANGRNHILGFQLSAPSQSMFALRRDLFKELSASLTRNQENNTFSCPATSGCKQ